MVLIETNFGNIKVELFKDKAPLSVENFLSYVKEGYYDSTIVHRVSTKQGGEKFVLQAGGVTVDMKQKPQKPGIKNEATNGLSNLRGTLSMARTSDINSGSSHFFINLSDNKFLDHTGTDPKTYGYAVFGKVVEGMDVVDKIGQSAVGSKGGYQDVPTKPVIMSKVTVVGVGSTATSQPKAEAKQAAEPETQNKPGETKPDDKGTKEPESKTTK
jgi:cyclophilin family peptidyl-prolyl cis-trans isomerase